MAGLAVLVLILHCVFGQEFPVKDTQYGPVRGLTLELHNGIEVDSFYGIPYAEPPLGDLRFRDPVSVQTPWDEVRDALELPASCMQSLGGLFLLTHPLWTNVDEDCLNLNVFSPTNAGAEPYPVMVWLHGGGYQSSANIQYPGHFLAMKDVVVVAPNYRLGHLGFAYTGDDNAPGNAGMKDQLMALEWVRDNIANFGGDPSKVTIFGQSAGGASTGLMLMSPQATGLFHQAILQSGTETAIWAVNPPQSNPETYVVMVAEQLDCPTDDNAAMMSCLRDVPARQLIRTDFNCTDGYVCLGMAPVVDGEGGFLPDLPNTLRLDKSYNMVPEMVTHTAEDAMLYALAFSEDDRFNVSLGFTHEQFEQILQAVVGFFVPVYPDVDREEDIFQSLSWFYSPWPYLDDPALNRHELGMAATDAAFGLWADLQTKHHSEDSVTYNMVFDYRSDGFFEVVPDWLGVFHAMDVPYVFGYPYLPFNPDVRNNSGINIDIINYNDEDREYFDFIGDMWTNFAKFGNPTPEPVQMPGGRGDITWTALENSQLNYMLVANEDIEMRQNYRQKYYAFWTEYLRCMVLPDRDMAGTVTECAGPIAKKTPTRKIHAGEIPSAMNPVEFNERLNTMYEEVFADALEYTMD